MLGEAAILWLLSIQPEKGFSTVTGGKIPAYVYIVLATVFLLGVWLILEASWTMRKVWGGLELSVRAPIVQTVAWGCLTSGAIIAVAMGHGLRGIILLFVAVLLPVRRKRLSNVLDDWGAAESLSDPTTRVIKM